MKIHHLILFTCLLLACGNEPKRLPDNKQDESRGKSIDSVKIVKASCKTDSIYSQYGLIDLKKFIPDIFTDLRYSSSNNFMKRDMYGCLEKVYAHPLLCEKLKRACDILKKENSELTFLVFDAVRPKSVQQKMWDEFDMPAGKKGKFLSNPNYGSLHNFGMAVDITLCDLNGKEVDMGTPYDDTARLAYPELEWFFLENGKLNKSQLNHRKLLRKVMYQAGFFGIQTEWWHFNACTRDYAKANYKLIE